MKKISIFIGTLIMLFLLLIACNSQPAADTPSKDEPLDSTTQQETTTPAEPAQPEGYVVEGKAFLILNPTEEASKKAVAKIKEKHGEDALAEIGSDIGFYLDDATTYAKKQGLKMYSTDASTILFKKDDGNIYKMENEIDGIGVDCYLFDGIQDPVKVKTIPTFSDGSEFQAYFK